MQSLGSRQFLLIATGLFIFVGLRWLSGDQNFSHFAVVGSDFVDSSAISEHIIVREGQGYDGQFFLRLAHSPLDIDKEKYGLVLDHPAYRSRRIGFPILGWLISFGGHPELIPFSLVLINVLCFWLICFLFSRTILEKERSSLWPLLLMGAWMALARDTAEVVATASVLACIYFTFQKKSLAVILFALIALLTRETTILATGPMLLFTALNFSKQEGRLKQLIFWISTAFSAIIYFSWVTYIQNHSVESGLLTSGNLGWPFMGVVHGAIQNLEFTSFKEIAESFFWWAFLFWNIALAWLSLRIINPWNWHLKDPISYLEMAVIALFCLALCLGPSVYVDDWAFVRVLTLWNALGLLLILQKRGSVPGWFTFPSLILLFGLVIRLIIRV